MPSGAIANLYAFMATCEPGDTIIAPPPSIGGHVTHHASGSAGMYRLNTVPAPVDPAKFTVDVDALRSLARDLQPKVITIGASLNLYPHPVHELREIADEVGAVVLFDAAHVCGLIAGGAWPNPLEQGAHIITMSTYKSLGGPPRRTGRHQRGRPRPTSRCHRLPRTHRELRRRQDSGPRPHPCSTGRPSARSAPPPSWSRPPPISPRDWRPEAYRSSRGADGPTRSHQFALEAHRWGGGQHAAKLLRQANLLTCGIGLATAPVPNDVNGLRIGTPELVRLGMRPTDMPHLASLIADGLDPQCDHVALATRVTRWRAQFSGVLFTLDAPVSAWEGCPDVLCRCHRVQVARRQPSYEDRAAHG